MLEVLSTPTVAGGAGETFLGFQVVTVKILVTILLVILVVGGRNYYCNSLRFDIFVSLKIFFDVFLFESAANSGSSEASEIAREGGIYHSKYFLLLYPPFLAPSVVGL